MVAQGYGLDDKLSLSGGTMSGTLHFRGNPPFDVSKNAYAGTATLNGTTAVSVAASGIDSNSLVFLTVQPGSAPLGTPYVASITAGTGFTLKSTNAGDTAVVVAWWVVDAV